MKRTLSLTGARIAVAVNMTSMDMGTGKPKAVEGKVGHYTAEVEFSITGTKRV